MRYKVNSQSAVVNFRADEATLKAIDKLAAAFEPTPGVLGVGGKSGAIRAAILDAAARLDAKGGSK